MGYTRKDAIERIEAQRDSIREHIEKYHRYIEDYDKKFALKTIENCQNKIFHIKTKTNSYIEDSYEDDWRP